MTDEKVLENRLRRVAERRGLQLQKSRRRDTMAIDYGGYMLVEVARNIVLCGGGTKEGYTASLDGIREFLEGPQPAKPTKFAKPKAKNTKKQKGK